MDNFTLYGTFLTAIALIISFLMYRYKIDSTNVKLNVKCNRVKGFQKNIDEMNKGYNPSTGSGGGNIAKIYEVEIQNIGNIEAYIENVGVMSKAGNRHVSLAKDYSFKAMSEITNLEIDPIQAKSSRTFSVYLKKDEEMFEVVYAYALDKIGKEWKS